MSFDAYILCTSPRSGSTMLCQMLRDTGIAGDPGSFFHRPTVEGWADALGISVSTQDDRPTRIRRSVDAMLPVGRGGTGIFAMRLQAHSRERFCAAMAALAPDRATDAERIDAVLGRTAFIYLHRADALERAVSYLRAEQSGLWHADEGDAPAIVQASYDATRIGEKFKEFKRLDKAWEAWFAANRIEPLRVDYADLSTDPTREVSRILTALGLDPSHARAVVPKTRKLADDTTTEWLKRFRAERT